MFLFFHIYLLFLLFKHWSAFEKTKTKKTEKKHTIFRFVEKNEQKQWIELKYTHRTKRVDWIMLVSIIM